MNDPFGHGSLTDVQGVLVGHHQRSGSGWLTGTTVVFCPNGATAAVDVRGGGPGTRETDALDAHNLVDRIHAVCLSGGSAYGLATADGVMAELERRHLGVPVGRDPHQVVPVVPTAVIFDLGRGGRFDRRPTADFGARALRAARRSPRRGSVGAGTGARAGGLRGGVGMASTRVAIDGTSVTVAAIAVLNAAGSPVDVSTGLPWTRVDGVRRPTSSERRAVAEALGDPAGSLNTTIGLVATDAVIERPEAKRMAMAAHDGLGRAVRPAHGLTDGDTIFAISTGAHAIGGDRDGLARTATSRVAALNAISAAAAQVFEIACVDALLTASSSGDLLAYLDLCPPTS